VGNDFVTNFSAAIFPLSSKIWIALNDKHNRGGAAPEVEFSAFWGRKTLGKKADNPNCTSTLEHLHEIWIGMNSIVKKGTWHVVACSLSTCFSLLISTRSEY
jgi:hypothetical protein